MKSRIKITHKLDGSGRVLSVPIWVLAEQGWTAVEEFCDRHGITADQLDKDQQRTEGRAVVTPILDMVDS
ncbi:hypothetical protein [Leucobacter sp. M11]|uniref:hypothetical protein n=1 Tax=Leucobacter sp. M11 TaxID=2993565 RepID=UPI002D80C5CB|nr:hypothetical protein [Leucobacter sp. M11]MEB4614016.1 hypothetical protein [Leucobacter sp. M11]